MIERVVISSGHGKYVRGASGYLDEVDEARRVVEAVANGLRALGIGVVTFHDDTSHDQQTNLSTIVDFHNAQMRDLDVSVHFNAYEETDEPMGTECLHVSQPELAAEVSAAIAIAADLPDRGAKYRNDLYFLGNTEEPAILIEVCFVDSETDADHYQDNFPAICGNIAAAIAGQSEQPQPVPPVPPPLERPQPPPSVTTSRPTLALGDYGSQVRLLQQLLAIRPHDGDFGRMTEDAVKLYQTDKRLTADGIVGAQTWAQLGRDFALPPYPMPLLPPLPPEIVSEIEDAASASDVADLMWEDRGVAPIGFVQGMAFAYATVVRKYVRGDGTVHEMAKADSGDSDTDALAYYRAEFQRLGLDNSRPGRNVLRHVFVFLMGLGMRESSGAHCLGRDESAGSSSMSSETCEAGAFQTSFNYHVCATDADELMDEYRPGLDDDADIQQCWLDVFARDVECSASNWENVGSGEGRDFQELSKVCPAFAVESAAVGIRNLRAHWGPIGRREVEIKLEALALFEAIDGILGRPFGDPISPQGGTWADTGWC